MVHGSWLMGKRRHGPWARGRPTSILNRRPPSKNPQKCTSQIYELTHETHIKGGTPVAGIEQTGKFQGQRAGRRPPQGFAVIICMCSYIVPFVCWLYLFCFVCLIPSVCYVWFIF